MELMSFSAVRCPKNNNYIVEISRCVACKKYHRRIDQYTGIVICDYVKELGNKNNIYEDKNIEFGGMKNR